MGCQNMAGVQTGVHLAGTTANMPVLPCGGVWREQGDEQACLPFQTAVLGVAGVRTSASEPPHGGAGTQ